MVNTSGRLHVLAISAAAHFHDLMTLTDHCLWVVVLDTLDLVVPLLKNTSVFPGVASTTKGVNPGGTHPQPSCEHAEEATDIHISPRGNCRLLHGLAWSQPLLPWKVTSLSSRLAILLSPGTSDCPRVTHMGVWLLTSGCL